VRRAEEGAEARLLKIAHVIGALKGPPALTDPAPGHRVCRRGATAWGGYGYRPAGALYRKIGAIVSGS